MGSRPVNRPKWTPPPKVPADLAAIRQALTQRLARARLHGVIPDKHPHLLNRKMCTSYDLAITRDLRTGQISAGVRIEHFEWLIPEPRTTLTTCRWLLGEGLALVAEVDRVLGRDQFSPPLTGRTLLIPEELPPTSSGDPAGTTDWSTE